MNMKSITTKRLVLRNWHESDLDAMAAVNADPKVIEYLGGPRDRENTRLFIEGSIQLFERVGYCFFAMELKATGELIGFTGMAPVGAEMPFAPAIEIGWRIASQHWGQGYAPEAAKALIKFAFKRPEITELVAFTATTNAKSIRVMEKLGMTQDVANSFHHPALPQSHPESLHWLYRING